MCGIVGYVGGRRSGTDPRGRAAPAGIPRLRQRRPGHRSTGGHLHLRKRAGRIADLVRAAAATARARAAPASATRAGPRTAPPPTPTPIRTSAATAPSPSSTTASSRTTPPSNASSQADGVVFQSDTDTEVIAQLIARHLDSGDLVEAVAQGAAAAQGHLRPGRRQPALSRPDRRRPPGQPAGASASATARTSWPAIPAPWSATPSKVVYLQDHQMCVLTPDELAHPRRRPRPRRRRASTQIDWDPGDADKGDFEHYMLKEIYEQPEALENAMRGRLDDADATRPLRRPQPRRRSSCAGPTASS